MASPLLASSLFLLSFQAYLLKAQYAHISNLSLAGVEIKYMAFEF